MQGSAPDELILRLGTASVLASLGQQSSLTISEVAGGVCDAQNQPVAAKTIEILETAPSYGPLDDLAVGQAVVTIVVSAPPFTRILTAEDLPDGLVLSTDGSGVQTINGTPTTQDDGRAHIYETPPVGDKRTIARPLWIVRQTPKPAFGV